MMKNNLPKKYIKGLVLLFAIFLASLLFSVRGFSQSLEGVPDSVQTPQTLVNWFSSEFKYQFELMDKWQSPQETIDSRRGDCEDFAVLASRVLGYLGIHNDVLIIKFNGGKLAHAICIWKDKEGKFRFISDKKLFRTGEKTIKNAIEKYYPDWENIILINEKGRYLETVAKKG